MARGWGDVIRQGNPISWIVLELTPSPGEAVLRKTQYYAFYVTNLEDLLLGKHARRLVIVSYD